MAGELKPCPNPRCKRTHVPIVSNKSGRSDRNVFVFCPTCGLSGPRGTPDDKSGNAIDHAISDWNALPRDTPTIPIADKDRLSGYPEGTNALEPIKWEVIVEDGFEKGTRKSWYSYCSMHREHNPDCPMCRGGMWLAEKDIE